jgi:hypothetical protein
VGDFFLALADRAALDQTIGVDFPLARRLSG